MHGKPIILFPNFSPSIVFYMKKQTLLTLGIIFLLASCSKKEYFEESGSVFHTLYHIKYQAPAILTEKIVAEDVAENKLTHVLPAWKAEAVTIYALTETRLLPAKTRVFIEFLREKLREKTD